MARHAIRTGAAVFALLLLSGLVSAQTVEPAKAGEEAKRADIRKLMDLTGSGKVGIQVLNQLMETFKAQYRQVPPQVWDDVAKEFTAEELDERLVPVYERHFTHDDIKALIQFYQSPLGLKVAKTMPQVARDAMEIGSQWGQEVGDRILKKLRQGGYVKQGT